MKAKICVLPKGGLISVALMKKSSMVIETKNSHSFNLPLFGINFESILFPPPPA